MDMKNDNSAMQCVNCPGATDHSTAECPWKLRGVEVFELYEDRATDPYFRSTVSLCRPAPGDLYVRLEDVRALLTAQPQASAAQSAQAGEREALWQLIHDTLRNYRMRTLDDGYGGGYPLIDAMTADGQPVSGGIEECTYLADAIWNELEAAWQRTQSGVPEGWRVSVEDYGNRSGQATISGPGVYCMQVPVSYSMLDFMRALAAAPAQPAARQEHGDRLREFADELKQLCKDFSDLQDRPYMGDVTSAIDGLYEQFTSATTSSTQHDQGEVQRLREVLESAEKNERHRNNSETRYWCDQYKQLARAILAASTGQEV